MQKNHDFGIRDSARLNGKYLIQYRSAIPRLQSNYDLAVARGTVAQSKESFVAFAERETVYFINFYRGAGGRQTRKAPARGASGFERAGRGAKRFANA
jgi:hypothetical protein